MNSKCSIHKITQGTNTTEYIKGRKEATEKLIYRQTKQRKSQLKSHAVVKAAGRRQEVKCMGGSRRAEVHGEPSH